MKTRHLFVCIVVASLILSACTTPEAISTTSTQTLLPTDAPMTESTHTDPITTYPPPGELSGPEVVRLGDLTMEIYEISSQQPIKEDGSFVTTAGPSSEILKTRHPLRDLVSQAFSPPPLNGRQLTGAEHGSGGKATVTFKLGDEEVLSVDCGMVSPVSNLRGMWVIGEDWYVEVAHTRP